MRRLKFEGEGAQPVADPAIEEIVAAVSRISPRGPSYFILSDDTGSYVQVAGARLRLTVEYRSNSRFGFRHFVLGREGRPETMSSVNYSGGAISLQLREILSLPAALEVLRTLFLTGDVPAAFHRRETTGIF